MVGVSHAEGAGRAKNYAARLGAWFAYASNVLGWYQIDTATAADAREALTRLDPLWEELFPAEQARIVQLLVVRVGIGIDDLTLRLRVDGLTGLAREIATTVARAA